ncbi:MAG TPA: exopolysaccharide biosynthesis polyprenyl glycosylphosphotransferase [Rariglobus sp.]|nr:exopolysaccharide biosynthesis polyprenyl glycosylphosphotransferase [Rariglobus sp.]
MAESARLRKVILPSLLVAGDAIVAFAGLSLGYWLRYATPIGSIGLDVPDATYRAYLPLLLLGTAFLIAAYAQLNLYEERLLLRKFQALNLIIKGTTFWLIAYLGLSLVLKFQPPISRWFVILAYVIVLMLMFVWRSTAYRIFNSGRLVQRLRQRVAILGWNSEADTLVADLAANPSHPFAFAGVITLPSEVPPAGQPVLGSTETLRDILRTQQIDVLIAARTDLPREQLHAIVEDCEKAFVDWKIIPSSFQILVSGLRLQTVGRLPVLGVEELAINRLFNRALKRIIDLTGALAGLVLSTPVIAVLALLIKRESPRGPVFFSQTRMGAGGRHFTMWKLRSMSPDAASSDHLSVSTPAGDTRLLRIGATLRRWNLDELPQFWNVLRGDMSLVGPRPERPHHVERLSDEIPHYLPRHLVKPGMTGWAQINGLRGGNDLARRIQHDIYYIENWSPWLDLQILILTLFRWRNPG